ncbi:MAG: PilZ domain-containing protein [Myxococcota bacterium]|nr:PilZ domain-containing protein [Myxococcota bacterium]
MDRPRPPVRSAPERRAHPRAALRLRVALEDASDPVFLPTADLSEGGLRLCGPVAPPPGTPVRLVLELPGEPVLQRLSGRVVRTWSAPEPGLAVAVDRAHDVGALRRVVERHLAWRRAS